MTLCFLSVKRPWLACIHVQIGQKILNSGLCMNARFHVCAGVYVEFECTRSCICLHAWMCQPIQDCPPCSTYSKFLSFDHSFAFSLVCTSLQDDTVHCRKKPPLLKSHWVGGQTPFCLSSVSFLCSSVEGQMRKIKPDNHMELWGKYLLPLVCFTE